MKRVFILFCCVAVCLISIFAAGCNKTNQNDNVNRDDNFIAISICNKISYNKYDRIYYTSTAWFPEVPDFTELELGKKYYMVLKGRGASFITYGISIEYNEEDMKISELADEGGEIYEIEGLRECEMSYINVGEGRCSIPVTFKANVN